MNGLFKIKFGSNLLSHTVASAVPSVLEGLTDLFGMERVCPSKGSLPFKRKKPVQINERAF